MMQIKSHGIGPRLQDRGHGAVEKGEAHQDAEGLFILADEVFHGAAESAPDQ